MDDFGDMTAAFGNDRMFGFSLSPGGDTDYDAPSPDLGGFDPTSAVLICSSGAIVSSGEVIDDAVIASGGNDSMYVTYGGTANSATVNFGGVMTVSRGTVNAATVNSYGGVSVFGGGIARQTVINSCGWLPIMAGCALSRWPTRICASLRRCGTTRPPSRTTRCAGYTATSWTACG